MTQEVLLVPTGTANLASVISSLAQVGARARPLRGADEILAAERVLLPGVGAFQAALEPLRASGYADALLARVQADRPLMGICLGMQLLAAASEESPGVPGLALFSASVTRLSGEGIRIPHIGWNRVEAAPGCRVLSSGDAYFAHSYCLTTPPAGACVATTCHGAPFVAALEWGAVVTCQFHPELSGAFGLDLLARWLAS